MYRTHPKPTEAHNLTTEQLARFSDSWERDSVTGCWEWKGPLTKMGYGSFWVRVSTWPKRRNLRAHRVSYELVNGYTELTIDHLCGNKCCVNPAHLEAVTTEVNTKRYFARHIPKPPPTHCHLGHDMTDGYIVGKRRFCRVCAARRSKEYNARKRLSRERTAEN
jgi:hypothetical protein